MLSCMHTDIVLGTGTRVQHFLKNILVVGYVWDTGMVCGPKGSICAS